MIPVSLYSYAYGVSSLDDLLFVKTHVKYVLAKINFKSTQPIKTVHSFIWWVTVH